MPIQSRNPVRYWSGAVVFSETDISVPSGGWFGHKRAYNNQTYSDFDGPNGFNWFVHQLPYAVASGSGTGVAIVFNPNTPYWFSKSGTTYTPMYGAVDVSLVENTGAHTLTFTRTTNAQVEVTVFNSTTASTNPGEFVSQTDYRGVTTTVASQTGSQINELQRSYTVSGTTTYESLLYGYFSSGSAAGKIQTVTYRTKVGTGSWTNVSQVTFGYYGTSDTQGSQNDLQTATVQQPNGSGGWNTIGVSYYRYYMSGATSGYAHGLKMHFGPEAYRQMFNAGINLSTATDATVKPYADHYFEYDPTSRRVTKEIAAVCAGCPGGGTTSDTFTFTLNSGSPVDYNKWSMKTVQTLPDSSQNIIYSNYAGLPMLKVQIDSSGSNKWITFFRYNSNGNVIWEAQPSAVNGYSDSYDDLLNYNSGTGLYQYLNNSTGLIKVTDYYTSTGSGGVAGYVSNKKIRQGQSGSDILLKTFTYTSNTAGTVIIYPVATEVVYPDASNPSTTITTSYSYSFYTGTNQIQQKTTTLPTVSSGQNGSGATVTIVEQYDAYGNLTQRTDQRLTVNQYVFDVVMSRVTQQTLNYQSGVTQPGVNVVSDFTYDNNGRLTQTLGPSHTVVLSGTATTVRPATWIVYVPSIQPGSGTWGVDENRIGRGYATGSSPSYTYALINPVTLNREDKNGRPTDLITSKRTSGSGALSASDTFSQTDWQTWKSTQYDQQGHKTSERLYFSIPSSGTGSSGTNYAETDYGYDALERVNRIATPGGTITRTVWTPPQRIASVWVGTNDTGATDSNPAGSGSPNNMVIITANQWDGGSAGGDGNLTQLTQYAASSDTRVTTYGYDWRDRRISADGEVDFYAVYTYDNLDRLTQTDRKNTTSGGNLIGRNITNYDDRNRPYQQLTYAVDPSTGTVGNALTTNKWYDEGSNVIQQINQGDGQFFSKSSYNGVNWITASYTGYNLSGTSYSQAGVVSGDNILSQELNTYDEVGNLISVTSYDRLNDAPSTGTGSTGALSTGTQPKGRASYTASWFDGIDRMINIANYGATSSFTRPSTPPSSSSTVLVTSTTYDSANRVYQVADPLGLVKQTTYDNANRIAQTIEAVSVSTGDDLNRTTNYTYTLDGLIASMTAINGRTGDQTTTYTYGTTTSTSGVARNDLLVSATFPDSVSGSDVISYTYNRQSQQVTVTDQRGTSRTLLYDKLGRQTDDCVTTVGSNTDNAVLRVSAAYEVRGMVSTRTSYNNATPGSGTAVNQIAYTFNTFSQLTEEQQDHNGTVSGSSPSVQYAYTTGATNSNQIRPTTLTYPNSRVITYDYGTSGGTDDYLNRIVNVQDTTSGTTTLATYTYLGQKSVIRIDYPQPQVRLDLWGGTSGTFNGLDLFNRVIDQRWLKYNTSTDLDRYQYGYDQDSNRIWKANAMTTGLDEYYTYDHLNRLATAQRGTLNGTKTGISGTPVREFDYTLDPTGNWRSYTTLTSGTTDLSQSRTSNKVNEITAVSGTPTWATPAYDAAGNMTTMPQVSTPSSSFTAVYDAWNRMVSLSAASGTIYKYDGQNRRIVKVTTSPSETRHFYYTGDWQDIEERTGSSTSMDQQYVWGIRYVDELVCRDDATPLRLYAMQDANFNLTAVCDTSANVKERYLFDPYADRTIMNASWSVLASSAYGWSIGRQGLLHDAESGLIYNRLRFVHALLGTFISRDLYRYIDGSSLYLYQLDAPLGNLDPLGASVLNNCLNKCQQAYGGGRVDGNSPLNNCNLCCYEAGEDAGLSAKCAPPPPPPPPPPPSCPGWLQFLACLARLANQNQLAFAVCADLFYCCGAVLGPENPCCLAAALCLGTAAVPCLAIVNQ